MIVQYNGQEVHVPSDLTRLVGLTEPGTKVEIKIIRDTKEIILKPVIATRNGDVTATTGGGSSKDIGKALGLKVRDCPKQVAARLGVRGCVIISDVKPGSAAATHGLRPGDAIVEVNRKSVRNVQDFQRLVRHTKKGSDILLLLARKGNFYYVVLPAK